MEEGILRKMKVEAAEPVKYWLNLNKQAVLELNSLLGRQVHLEWLGDMECIACGRSIRKTYGQGFCYPCFRDSPQAAPCIMRPELCEAHLGKGRDVEWEESHHNQPHVVYLALTSDVKVGVTRATQVPTRWIDQGAWKALKIAETPYRQLAGRMEVELKQYVSERTDWRKMLVDKRSDQNLKAWADELSDYLPSDLETYLSQQHQVQEILYPVQAYPSKVSSIDLDKVKSIDQKLQGIRGQYLIFEGGSVINLRKYSGYRIRFSA